MGWGDFLLGAYLGGLIPVLLQFAYDWREGEWDAADWPATLLFVLGWPIAAAWATVQLVRGREL